MGLNPLTLANFEGKNRQMGPSKTKQRAAVPTSARNESLISA